MIWEIGGDWRVRTEPMNYVVERLGITTSRETGLERPEWKFEGYYGTFSQALRSIPDAMGLDPEVQTVLELLERLQTLAKLYEGGIAPSAEEQSETAVEEPEVGEETPPAPPRNRRRRSGP